MCLVGEDEDQGDGRRRNEESGCSSRWALGTLVLVGLASSEISGAGTIASLPIASLTITLSGIFAVELLNNYTKIPMLTL